MIPIDKQNHFIAGLCIYTISSLFMPTMWAMIPVVVIGTAKEVYDYISKKGTPELNDLLYTIYGAIPLLIIKLFIT
jgi:hypothetical protein